jgi:hypothetical protein
MQRFPNPFLNREGLGNKTDSNSSCNDSRLTGKPVGLFNFEAIIYQYL